MRFSFRTVGALVIMVSLVSAAHADDKDVVEYRRHIMSSLNEQSAILGQIVSGAIPEDNLVQHLDTLALLASTARKSFEPKVQGGESKPEVWTKWPDFAKRMDEFAQKTAEASKLAHTQGGPAALANMLDVLTCKSCHEVYREEKK
jgi:cytochrome c556